jgi:O-antigen/teichoic acid export membrane protein
VLLVLLAFVLFKLSLLFGYIRRFHGFGKPLIRWRSFTDQLLYAAPLGAAGALYGLRTQADQWVVAALFPLGMFAAFSIAAILGPVLNLFRQSVNLVFLPIMSRRQANGDITGLLELNSRGNIMVGAVVFPLFAYVFVFANEIVTLVYTAKYLDAGSVMRVYILGTMALVIELSTLTMLLRQAVFVVVVNAIALAIGVVINWYSALHFGLAAAAVGGTFMIHVDRAVTLWRISSITGVPIRRLQDWKSLMLFALFAILSASLAWGIDVSYFAQSGLVVRMLVGAIGMAGSYALICALSGIGRVWLTSVHSHSA